jgi:hypothetical protein
MIKSALLAISDVLSSDLQSVLWKAIGLALALFVTILVGAEALFWFMQFLHRTFWPSSLVLVSWCCSFS